MQPGTASPRDRSAAGGCSRSPRSAGGSTHGASLLSSVLTSNAAAAAAAAAKLIDGFDISGDGGSRGNSVGSKDAVNDKPSQSSEDSGEWECEGGGQGSMCAFDVHSALRRLDLIDNQGVDDEVRQRFQRLIALDGSKCAVNI